MKYFLPIFALLIACSDENEQRTYSPVIISDASPIQFWPTDCNTYNEKEVCGVHVRCYCQPWQCDDNLNVQFTDIETNQEFTLGINNTNGLIESLPFTKTEQFTTENKIQFNNSDFELNIAAWSQYAAPSSSGWSWSFGGLAKSDGSSGTLSQTAKLYQNRDVLGIGNFDKYPPGDYIFKVRVKNLSSGGSAPLQEGMYIQAGDNPAIFGEGVLLASIIPRGGGYVEYIVNLTTTKSWSLFSIMFYKLGPSSGSAINIEVDYFEIESSPLDYTQSIYNTSFTPQDENICDEQISLEIINNSSPETIVFKSDCIDVRTSHSCTLLIEYSNNRNFAGLIYQNASPEESFKIRVPAIFFHDKFPEEDQAIELTTGIQKTSGFLKSQRLFETDYMPYFMHKKLKLIFMHQSILIDNLYWLKEQAYEISEGDRRWPVKKGKVFLTSRDDVNRATL